MDYSPPGSCVHGISQAGILEWVAIFFPKGSSRPRDGPCTMSPLSPALQADSLPTEPLGKPQASWQNCGPRLRPLPAHLQFTFCFFCQVDISPSNLWCLICLPFLDQSFKSWWPFMRSPSPSSSLLLLPLPRACFPNTHCSPHCTLRSRLLHQLPTAYSFGRHP